MGRVLGALVVLVGFAGSAFAGYRLADPSGGAPLAVGAFPRSEPGPGDPPLVWVSGTLAEVAESHLLLQEGRGAEIRLERLAQGATSFLRAEDGVWREIAPERADAGLVGEDACVEAFLDRERFVSIRVFLGAACGPG